MRAFRFRLTLVALILVIALIGAFGTSGKLFSDNTAIFRDPGQLLDVHAGVIGENNCGACHEPHDLDAAGFTKAVFTASGPTDGMSNNCLSCHTFPGKTSTVHTSEQCTVCHTEHKGSIAAVTTLTDSQCHACHKVKFATFELSHPEFGETYPYKRRTSIFFDHTKHLDSYFKDERFAEKAPEGRCIGCHIASKASSRVPIKRFEETCGKCHEEQIAQRDLILFTLPELEKNPIDREIIADACSEEAAKPSDDYLSVSIEPMNGIMAALFDVDPTDIESYQESVGKMLNGMASEGTAPFTKLLREMDGRAEHLLNGLSPNLLHTAACNWAANEEYETPGEPEFGGWYASEFSIAYRPVRHRDPIMTSWLNFAGSAELQGLTDTLMKPDGPGSCVKCHSVNETFQLQVGWSPVAKEIKPHHKYSHAPHLNLLGPGSQCETCHTLNKEANYAAAFKQKDPEVFQSNFGKIDRETCATCHRKGQVVQGCLTCHKYHEQTGFKDRMMVSEFKTQRMGQ